MCVCLHRHFLESALCMVVRVTSKPVFRPQVPCPCCQAEGDWEPVGAALIE